ncbi:MAG TPA: helix-turn-helix transcriptional regulator [Acidobacteriaceae bacterium]
MPDRGSPSVRGRRLAAELRRLRERTGLTGEEVADRLGWSGSKVSRIELHRIGVKQADLRRLLDLYHVDERRRGELLALGYESSQKGSLEVVAASFPPDYAAYINAEAEAQSVWNWDPQIVPGLLQTPEYALAVMQPWTAMFPGPPGEMSRRIEARMLRQQCLTGEPPLDLSVVIDESVLHRRFGSQEVMRAQMEHMAKVSELPNVEVRVHRLDGNAPPLTTGAFSYMQFLQVHDVPLSDIVSVEHLEGNYYLEDEERTYRYRVAFEYLMRHALDPDESRSLIASTAHALRS